MRVTPYSREKDAPPALRRYLWRKSVWFVLTHLYLPEKAKRIFLEIAMWGWIEQWYAKHPEEL